MKKSILLLLLISQCIINTSCNQEQTNVSEINDKSFKIDSLVGLYTNYEGFNGSVLVSHKGKIIYKKGFGFANMEWDIPNQIDTKFQIASITKPFTAMLIMQLVAENKLDLHKPISTYLPDFPKENGEQITIHHLLTHSSGIAREGVNDKKQNSPKAMVNQFAGVPLEFKPGKRFSYSNSGYTLLGYIIETITESSYEAKLQEKIFKPLGMKNSGYFRNRPLINKMASGYNKGFGDYFNADGSDESTAYAAGAIYSTVEDMFLWDQALLNETLLPKEYMNMLFEKHIVDPDYGHYGYGWEIINKPIGNTSETIETVGHSGSIDGFRSLYTRIPSSNSSIIFLNNTNRAFLISMTKAITGILYDKPYDFPIKPLAKFMAQVIEKEGVEKGIQFYKDHKNDSDYHVSEQELIVAGYKLLHADNAKDAVEVFKLSTEIFPNKDNPYDSYAEALMVLGNNDEAILNYKKSLQLNPKNNNAIKMLEKLGVDASKINDVLDADDSWGKELFAMPLHFARDIKLNGIEDARFPKGWLNTESHEFWSYVFGWNVSLTEELTESQLEDYMQKYYDGLSNDVNKDRDRNLPKAIAKFSKTDALSFEGKVTIYDSFVTKKQLDLNIRVTQQICHDKNKSAIIFRISPAPFINQIWNKLEEIKIRKDICK